MNLIYHFKATMQKHFPDHDISINECDDQSFLDAETQAMWMMFQACNAWQPIETVPKDSTAVDLWCSEYNERLTNYRYVKMSPTNEFFDPIVGGRCCVRTASHWRPLPIPPLTTEGGV